MVILFLLTSVVCGNARLIQVMPENQNEPRLFFKQIIEASGLVPLEINVPDTLGAMMSGMNYMYQAASNYFSGGSEGEGGEQQVVYDEVDVNTRPINGKHRRKKVKKLKKKTPATDDDDENVFDLFNFLMF